MSFSELFPCPCCRLPTLDAQHQNDVCPECGWEDDGQDDTDADVVRGGPNGSRSLTEARAVYQEALAQSVGVGNQDSFSAGGPGLWWAMALRQAAVAGVVPVPTFDLDADPELELPDGE